MVLHNTESFHERNIRLLEGIVIPTKLRSPEERVRLLKAGLKGKQIEKLYVQKNGFVVLGVNWQEE